MKSKEELAVALKKAQKVQNMLDYGELSVFCKNPVLSIRIVLLQLFPQTQPPAFLPIKNIPFQAASHKQRSTFVFLQQLLSHQIQIF